MNASCLIKATACGYRDAHPAERGVFGMATSFALTVAVSRTINYVLERRRNLPLLRSLGRRLYYRLPGAAGGVRVHHFIPGIGLCFATGGATGVAGYVVRSPGSAWGLIMRPIHG